MDKTIGRSGRLPPFDYTKGQARPQSWTGKVGHIGICLLVCVPTCTAVCLIVDRLFGG